MAYNNRKILGVLLDELAALPERCEGYQEDMTHLLTEVLNLEQEHAIKRIDIVKRIGDQVNTVGMSLHKSRRKDAT